MLVKIAGEKVREWKCSRCQREKNFSIDVTQSAQQKLSIFDDAQLLCLVVKILPDYKRIEWLYSDVNKLIESMMFESKTIIGKTNNRQRLRLSLHGFAHKTRLYLPDSLLTCERERRPFCRFFPINNLLVIRPMWINFHSLRTIASRLIWQQQQCRLYFRLHLPRVRCHHSDNVFLFLVHLVLLAIGFLLIRSFTHFYFNCVPMLISSGSACVPTLSSNFAPELRARDQFLRFEDNNFFWKKLISFVVKCELSINEVSLENSSEVVKPW